MLDLINWYLVDLKMRLVGQLTSDQVETILTEARSHLTESMNELQTSKGLSSHESAVRAIEMFGSPTKVADSYVAEMPHQLFVLNQKLVIVGACLIAAFCWVHIFTSFRGYFDTFGDSASYLVAGPVGFFAIGVIVIAVIRARHAHIQTILISGLVAAALAIPLTSFWIVGSNGSQGFNRFHLSRDIDNAKLNLDRFTKIQAFYKEGIQVFASAKTVKDIPPKFQGGWIQEVTQLDKDTFYRFDYGHSKSVPIQIGLLVVPSTVMTLVDGRFCPYAEPIRFDVAKAQWQSDGPTGLASITQARQSNLVLLNAAKEAQSGRLFFFNPDVYQLPVSLILVLTAILLGIANLTNWLNHQRRIPIRCLA